MFSIRYYLRFKRAEKASKVFALKSTESKKIEFCLRKRKTFRHVVVARKILQKAFSGFPGSYQRPMAWQHSALTN